MSSVLRIFGRSTSSAGAGANPLNQLALPAPPSTNGPAPTTLVDPKMDLLSGDDFSSPKAEASLALVPVGGQQPSTPASQQNALVLFDMFSDGNTTTNSVDMQSANLPGQTSSLTPQAQHQQAFQSSQGGFYPNGTVPNMGTPQYEQSLYPQGTGPSWNGQIAQPQQPQQPQQPPSPVYGAFVCLSYLHENIMLAVTIYIVK